ncbi:hypothetical protein ACMHYB_45090 [Sorangium sp. So ce1128]
MSGSFIPVDELVSAQSADEVFDLLLSMLEQMQVPARSWRKASALRTILRASAIVAGNWTSLCAAIAKFGFLDKADGPWLTLLASYVYGVDRKAATFATFRAHVDRTRPAPSRGLRVSDSGILGGSAGSTDAAAQLWHRRRAVSGSSVQSVTCAAYAIRARAALTPGRGV